MAAPLPAAGLSMNEAGVKRNDIERVQVGARRAGNRAGVRVGRAARAGRGVGGIRGNRVVRGNRAVGGRRIGNRRRGNVGRGIGIGAAIIGGAILSGAARASNRGGDAWDRCARTYRSFERRTGMYTGYDGVRRRCPYL